MISGIVFAGYDTTRNQLGQALFTFARHPGQWALLGEQPELAEVGSVAEGGDGPAVAGDLHLGLAILEQDEEALVGAGELDHRVHEGRE